VPGNLTSCTIRMALFVTEPRGCRKYFQTHPTTSSNEEYRDMLPNGVVTESSDTTKTPLRARAVASFGRKFLNRVTVWGLCASGGVSGALLILAVLTILAIGQPHPGPNPSPQPF
jgi:uncharacterized protein (UPF0261 family)